MRLIDWKQFLVASATLIVVAGCAANRPAVSPIQGSSFSGDRVSADRLYVICNMPLDYRRRVAEPFAEKLRTVLAEKGANATVELQNLNPLALDSGINFRGAQRHSASAILLVRMGDSSFGSGGSYWTINFDLLNPNGKGVWRGRSTIHRLYAPDEVTEQLSRELLKGLMESNAISLPGGENRK